jgi:DNA-binding transcriptional regulator YdaS (Cro superfamily)
METPLDKAIKAAGGQVALAEKIGKGQSTVSLWRRQRRVPAEYCRAIETATGGAVTRHELRPDIFDEPPAKPAKRSAGKPSVSAAA